MHCELEKRYRRKFPIHNTYTPGVGFSDAFSTNRYCRERFILYSKICLIEESNTHIAYIICKKGLSCVVSAFKSKTEML